MLHVRERLHCAALTVRDDAIESLWVMVKGVDSKADTVMGVYY